MLVLCRVLPCTGFREGCSQVINTLPGLYPGLLARPVNPRWPLWLTMLAVGSVALPMESLLDGIPCRIQSDRRLSPLQGLMVSRYPGGYVFTVHLGVGLAPTW